MCHSWPDYPRCYIEWRPTKLKILARLVEAMVHLYPAIMREQEELLYSCLFRDELKADQSVKRSVQA